MQNLDLELPKNKLITFTGISGSGKSSLAFDTIYAEGQRRYVESLSAYARQFLGVMDKPDVDTIEGLSPAISIDQKSTSHNPRSTVGTVTEIYDYLRLLFARIGHPHCPNCGREISKLAPAQIKQLIIDLAASELARGRKKFFRFLVLAPVVRDRKGEFTGLFANLRAKGYRQVRLDGHFVDLDEDLYLLKTNKHTIEVVIDRFSFDKSTIKALHEATTTNSSGRLGSLGSGTRTRFGEAIERALVLSDGLIIIARVDDADFNLPPKPKKIKDFIYSEKFACPVCGISLSEIEPRSFSFNSPHGACPTCSGIGSVFAVDPTLVLNSNLSITEGGISPFAKMFFRDNWYARVITAVAGKAGIDIHKPLSGVTAKQREILLFGTGKQIYHVAGTNRFGEMTAIEETFSGIVPELRRRYLESESEFVRAEIEKYMRTEICTTCQGTRLKRESLTITIDKFSISDVTNLSINEALEWVGHLQKNEGSPLGVQEKIIAAPILKEIVLRLQFLMSVGLDYLTLARGATTLAGGEAQRIRLASQIGSGLSGVLYVLDEPSIGLHQRDNKKLIATLKQLRDLGNTVIVVEHDREMMEESDHLVDFGPGAGDRGGKIVAQGTPEQVKKNSKSLTAAYLNGKRQIVRSLNKDTINFNFLGTPRQEKDEKLVLVGAGQNNLQKIDVEFPLGKFICVTGVSGSGKSTLVVETLYWALYNHFNLFAKQKPGIFEELKNVNAVDKVILIDQSPIGRTPRSNPATYTSIFSHIREIFAMLPQARQRGYGPGRFSFNVKGGRCEACEGEGQIRIEMQFLSDVYVTCEVCHGSRYNSETLEVTYRGKNIAQVLDLSVDEALLFFENHPALGFKLQTLADVGLGYIHLGQPATTLSGGEAQRVKLAEQLNRRATGRTVYILDEPTTGLHFADLEKLLNVLHRLTVMGNTVIVIEHNLDMIKNADWIIDLGPEGGDQGGKIVATGTPQMIAKFKHSYTGQFLAKMV